MPQSPPAAGPARRHERHVNGLNAQAQAIADALENPRDDFDRLIGDLRLATRFEHRDYDDTEARAQAIIAAIVRAVRGAPSAAPLWAEQRGGRARAIF